MDLNRILGFLVKRFFYVVGTIGLIIFGQLKRQSPTQPDPASGHVFQVIVPHGRTTARHTLYLISTERSLFYGSYVLMAAALVGVVVQSVMLARRNSTTSPS